MAAVSAMVREPNVRLLTLTGPGGVGKTRLAIEVANVVKNDFPDGVAFVDLAPVSSPDLVLNTIAGSLQLRDTGSGAIDEQLSSTIGNGRMLLVIDNFEQVVTAAPVLRALLERCPQLALLITSRIRLRISGEREFAVAPLALDEADPTERSNSSRATRLFLERTQEMIPDFDPGPETLLTIGEIVRRVDGLPLAIELAAARIKSLPPEMLLQRMERRLPLLSGGPRDLPLRQQTMRDAIGWSHDLLNEKERGLFRRLGVFAGGFTLEAAESIAGSPDGSSLEVIDGLAALIDQSLLQQHPAPDGEPRYQMLEIIREHAGEGLSNTGESEEIHRRHADHFLALAEAGEPHLAGAQQGKWLAQLDRERDNLRAALKWAVTQRDAGVATRLCASLWRYWERRGLVSEGRSHLARVLELPWDANSLASRAGALTGAGVLAVLQGDYVQAIQLCEEALAHWRVLGDDRGTARTLLCQATIARHRDDYASAELLGQHSLAAYEEAGDRWGMGHVSLHLGMVAMVQGDRQRGTGFYENALQLLRDAGDQPGVFEVLLELGKGASDAGDLNGATALFDECLALATELDDGAGRAAAMTEFGVAARRKGNNTLAAELFAEAMLLARSNGDQRQVAYLSVHLGDIAVALGEIGAAATQYAAGLELFDRLGNRVGIAHCLEAIARCAANSDMYAPAVRLLASASALFNEIGAVPAPDGDPSVDIASIGSNVSPPEFADLWDAGLSLGLAEAMAEAHALATDLASTAAGDPSDAESIHSDAVPPKAAARGLTPREVEVLRLLADGLSDRQIAETLFISERTAGNHVQHAMQKIGANSRTAAAVFAVRHIFSDSR